MAASTVFNGDEDDDEVLTLPHDTIAALQDFYYERDQRQQNFDNLKAQVHHNSETQLSMEMFSEDWNASQFWYNDETAIILAKQLLEGATPSTQIAVVSAPSVFIQLKNLITSGNYGHPRIALLEFDDRFSVFSDFIHYDFNCPLKLPPEFKGSFDRILCDPPFLSADCQTKTAVTTRWLLRPHSILSNDNVPRTSIIEYEQQRTNHDTIKTGSATNSRPLRITNVTFGNGGKILLQSLGGVGRTAVRRSFDVSGQMIDDYSAQPRI